MANSKNLLLTILIPVFLLCSAGAEAQKTYFVYLQSDNQQPFYINIHGKNVSSSAIGYVILPKLTDSTYPVKIGFTSGAPVQEFDLVVSGNDQGFIIKDFGEKGFGLFNLQSLTVQMNVNGMNKQKAELALQKEQEEKRVNDSLAAEALLLAEKQKADSIKYASEQQEKKKVDDSVAVVQKESKPGAGTGIVVAAGAAAVGTVANGQGEKATAGTETVASNPATAVVAAPVAIGNSTPADSLKKASVPIDSSIVKDSSNKLNPDSSALLVKDSMALLVHDTTVSVQPVDSAAVANSKPQDEKKDSSAMGKSTVHSPPAGSVAGGAAVVGGAAVATAASDGSPNFLDMELGGDSTQVEIKPSTKDSADSATILKDSTHKDSALTNAAASKNNMDTTLKAGVTQTSSATGSITMNSPNTSVAAPAAGVAGVAVVSEKSPEVTNNSCKKIAGEKDFYSVRKKMVANDDPAQMILTAKGAFKEKCFTNEQLRNLCVLFLDDASRYRFLDEAYPYTTDPQSYKQLGDLLKDDYYNRRFNAMLK